MKTGYVINNKYIDKMTCFIIVSNYCHDNEITNWGYKSLEDSMNDKSINDIGMWHVKHKAAINA